MNDFLGRLAARALGETPLVKPRVRSRYEPGGAPQAGEAWGEEVVGAAAREDDKDGRDDREGQREGAREAPSLEVPVERRVALTEPAVKAVEPREARLPRQAVVVERVVEAAPHPVPAPTPEEARPRLVQTAREAARATVAPPEVPAPAAPMPVAAPAPEPRRSEPRISSPPEPGPRLARRAEEPEPAVPAPPPEARPAVRMSRPAERPTEPLPTVGPRRGAPDLVPSERGGEPAAAEEVVRVSIGRIDVHAGPPAAPAPAPRRPAGPRLSLADYLKARNERRR